MTEHNKYHTFKADEIPCQEISDPAVLSKNPLVSVKMITYNHEPYIAQAIEGVLMQGTDFPIELIIGEDCSTDGTRNIVSYYQKKYPDIIRVITSDKNVGACKNGLRTDKACRGKYIAYCEGDDYWHHPLKLQKQVDYLESHPDVGLVHSDYDVVQVERCKTRKSCNKSRDKKYSDVKDVFSGILLGTYEVCTATVCARRELVEQALKQDKDIFSSLWLRQGDLPRWLNISCQHKFYYIDEALATYRILPESAAHSKLKWKNIDFQVSSKKNCLYFAEKYNCAPEVLMIVKNNYYSVLLNKAYHTCNKSLARDSFRKIIELNIKPSLFQRLYFWGGINGLFKGITMPFMYLRRVWLYCRGVN